MTTDRGNRVLGRDPVQPLAQKLGVDPERASALITQALPPLIDRLMPQGAMEQGQSGTPAR